MSSGYTIPGKSGTASLSVDPWADTDLGAASRTPAVHLLGFRQQPRQPQHPRNAHDHRDVHQGGDPRADRQPRRLRRRQVGTMRWQRLQRLHQLRERIEVCGDQRILFAMSVMVRCVWCTRNWICVRWTSRADAMRAWLGDNTQRGSRRCRRVNQRGRGREYPGLEPKTSSPDPDPDPAGGKKRASVIRYCGKGKEKSSVRIAHVRAVQQSLTARDRWRGCEG